MWLILTPLTLTEAINAAEKERKKITPLITGEIMIMRLIRSTLGFRGILTKIYFGMVTGWMMGEEVVWRIKEELITEPVYDPEVNFDLNQEPATDEKVGSSFL